MAKTWQRAAALAGVISLAAAGATALWFRRMRYAPDWQPLAVGQPDAHHLAARCSRAVLLPQNVVKGLASPSVVERLRGHC